MSELLNKICGHANIKAAFTRVQANEGCRGSDGVTLRRFEMNLEYNLRDLSNCLASGDYHPFPLLRFPVPKRSPVGQFAGSPVNQPTVKQANQLTGKPANRQTGERANSPTGQRLLSVPTVRDRVAQAAVFLATKDIFEAEFENISHGYREGRGVRTAVYDIKTWRDKGYRFAVDADIDSYFDSVAHGLLLEKLNKLFSTEPALLRLFEKWIRVEVYDGDRIWTLEKGIPQGSVVSPVLANLFLDELDETLTEFGLKLVRYADDFLILTKSEKKAEDAIEITDMLLDDMQLDLNPVKTKIVSFDRGFKFLGAIFVRDGIFLPFPEKREKHKPPKLPPPLTLRRYLELRNKS